MRLQGCYHNCSPLRGHVRPLHSQLVSSFITRHIRMTLDMIPPEKGGYEQRMVGTKMCTPDLKVLVLLNEFVEHHQIVLVFHRLARSCHPSFSLGIKDIISSKVPSISPSNFPKNGLRTPPSSPATTV